ncbi:MAG TPA: acetolactate synthase, partial [Candidatus Methanomethylia archaeon]|nr:acetolactate synthase [Candidatus Methanomethylicia archaeon]
MITQLSVFLENKPGRLSEMARLLQEAGVNIKAMWIAEAGNYGIVRMVIDNVDLAVEALQKAGMAVSKVDILAIDMRAGVYQISKILGDHEINIDYA